MPLGEIFLKLSVTFADDPKVCALVRYGVDGILARDLYVQMCLYCKRMLTDGFVQSDQVGRLSYPVPPDHANQLAKQLASVGLIKEVTNEASNPEAQGWQVLAYLKRNGTKEDVERLSEVRAEAGRVGGLKSRKPPGQNAEQANRKQVAKPDGSKSKPETETESETESELLNPVAAQAPPSKRGARIPDDFADTITVEMVTWAKEKCPHVDGKLETEKFVNYWQSKAGRDACKLDWVKTWKNRMLDVEQQASRGRPSSNGRGPAVDPRDEWKVNRA
jgi:hypothetical protein